MSSYTRFSLCTGDPCAEFTSSSPVDALGQVFISGDQYIQDLNQTDADLPEGYIYCDTDIAGQIPVFGDYELNWDV